MIQKDWFLFPGYWHHSMCQWAWPSHTGWFRWQSLFSWPKLRNFWLQSLRVACDTSLPAQTAQHSCLHWGMSMSSRNHFQNNKHLIVLSISVSLVLHIRFHRYKLDINLFWIFTKFVVSLAWTTFQHRTTKQLCVNIHILNVSSISSIIHTKQAHVCH